LPAAVRRLVRDWSIRPGNRAVVITAREPVVTADLEAAGVEIARVVDLRDRQPQTLRANGRRGRGAPLSGGGSKIGRDLLVVDGGGQPAYSLLAQAGAKIEYDEPRGVFVPKDLPPNVEAVGSVTGSTAVQATPLPVYAGKGKCFVCFCEDVTVKDMRRA